MSRIEQCFANLRAAGGTALLPFITMFGLFLALKSIGMLRVSKEEELRGLDIGEHGEEAYSGFQIFTTN